MERLTWALAAITTAACAVSTVASTRVVSTAPVKGARSYLELPLDASGEARTLPYIWERRVNKKHIVVVGTRHVSDPRSPMYPRIQTIFERVRPQLVLHESEAPEALKKMKRDEAIKVGADLGFAVHLAGQYGARTRSADASPKEEIKALLTEFSAQEVLVFLTAQRLIGNVRKPNLDLAAAEYPRFYADYLVANGLPGTTSWQTWPGFLEAYENVVDQKLSPRLWNRDLFSPIKRTGRLSTLARSLNAIRDRRLLHEMRTALTRYDRVVVVFGSWHVLALEPVLESVLAR